MFLMNLKEQIGAVNKVEKVEKKTTIQSMSLLAFALLKKPP